MEKITSIKIREMKASGEKIVMLATYDYLTAKMVDEAGADAILVGDSLANVVLGHRDTLSVGMEEMLHHTRAVANGVKRALVVGDMPFMSYQASTEDAIRNAGRFLKEGHAEAVKVEGGRKMIRKIEAIIDSGVPVMGHLGLTPQWVHQFGGYRVRGKTWSAARAILDDAKRLEQAGVFSIVLEAMPWQLAKLITEKLEIPTIGIGAGPYCDGQVLVLHDLIGLTGSSVPRFVKRYAEVDKEVMKALESFKRDVKSGKFPSLAQSYEMPPEEMRKLIRGFRQKK
ncbi:MAG: 3-methyl-2-oxobutanoate hydroxymethyltransferase [Hadesarchaea archaeon]|nr:3-methyl-2-oxobutanoate hydroxymethyltransferase [Hadesarchaea archaeon]